MATFVQPPLAVYIHFPWCVRKCPYCDFNSHALGAELEEQRYVEALEADLESQAAEVAKREVGSIFLGGGTPSLFSPQAMQRVLAAVRRYADVAADVEVTMEANPGAIERGRFAEYRAAGLTRVSLGAQSFDAECLKALGRIHSPDETRIAVEELHRAGLDNFNLDLMYALPRQTLTGAVRDVETALALHPAHLSHYQLTLEAGTVFAAQPPELPGDEQAAEMLDICGERLAAAGFAQYEVSAYARGGRQCRHNRNYWLFGDYLGVGAGAHGKLTSRADGSVVRTLKQREPRRYLARPAETARRPIPATELPFEFMLNALRLLEGFEIATFTARTGLEWSSVATAVEDLRQRGLLQSTGMRVRVTDLGLRFLNDVLLSFLAQTPKTTGAFGLSTVV